MQSGAGRKWFVENGMGCGGWVEGLTGNREQGSQSASQQVSESAGQRVSANPDQAKHG
jgi:hypothetical protein